MKKLLIAITLVSASLTAQPDLEILKEYLPAEEFAQVYQEYEDAILLLKTMPPDEQKAVENELNTLLHKATNNRSASKLCTQLRLLEQHRIIPSAFTHPSSMYWFQQPGMLPLNMLAQNNYFTPVWRALGIVAIGALAFLVIKGLKTHQAKKELKREEFRPSRQKADIDFVRVFARQACHLLGSRRRS